MCETEKAFCGFIRMQKPTHRPSSRFPNAIANIESKIISVLYPERYSNRVPVWPPVPNSFRIRHKLVHLREEGHVVLLRAKDLLVVLHIKSRTRTIRHYTFAEPCELALALSVASLGLFVGLPECSPSRFLNSSFSSLNRNRSAFCVA